MSTEPSNQLPVTAPGQDGPWPNQLQLPIQTRKIVDASRAFFDQTQNSDAIADAIVDYYAASVWNFVQVQRRDYAAGINQVHNRYLQLPGLGLRYENMQGMERLTMVAQPESALAGGQLIQDINYDGYVIFILYDPTFPNIVNGQPGYPKSFDIYMNGYLIKKGWMITQMCQAFVVMFGRSSLRCHSLIDQFNLSPFRNDPAYPLLPFPSPPRSKVDGHDDLPAYTLFKFTDMNNPIYTMNDVTQFDLANPLMVNVTDGVQFFDPTKSPLNTKKGNSTNYFGVTLSYGLTQGTENVILYMMFAEFFSRTKLRPVTQSWNKIAPAGNVVIANDKPLYWGNTHIQSYTELTPGQNGMGFDLWDEMATSDDDVLAAVALIGTANNPAPFGKSIPPESDDALVEYRQHVNQLEQEFQASHLPAVEAALATLNAARAKVNDDDLALKHAKEALLVTDDEIANDLLLIQQGGNPTILGLELANSRALLPVYRQAIATADDDLMMDTTALNGADENFTNIASEQPTLPAAPQIQGNDIDDFVWRAVNVSGDDWTFGGWMNQGT